MLIAAILTVAVLSAPPASDPELGRGERLLEAMAPRQRRVLEEEAAHFRRTPDGRIWDAQLLLEMAEIDLAIPDGSKDDWLLSYTMPGERPDPQPWEAKLGDLTREQRARAPALACELMDGHLWGGVSLAPDAEPPLLLRRGGRATSLHDVIRTVWGDDAQTIVNCTVYRNEPDGVRVDRVRLLDEHLTPFGEPIPATRPGETWYLAGYDGREARDAIETRELVVLPNPDVPTDAYQAKAWTIAAVFEDPKALIRGVLEQLEPVTPAELAAALESGEVQLSRMSFRERRDPRLRYEWDVTERRLRLPRLPASSPKPEDPVGSGS